MYDIGPILPLDRQIHLTTEVVPPALLDRVRCHKKLRDSVFDELHKQVDDAKAELQSSQLIPGDLALIRLTGSETSKRPPKPITARYSTVHRVLASDGNGAYYDVLDLQTGLVRRLSHRLLRRFTLSLLTGEKVPEPYNTHICLPRAGEASTQSWGGQSCQPQRLHTLDDRTALSKTSRQPRQAHA